jgi:hypothetical protein
MVPSEVVRRLDESIELLLRESNLPSSSMALMLMAIRESMDNGSLVNLASRVWEFNNSRHGQPSAAE